MIANPMYVFHFRIIYEANVRESHRKSPTEEYVQYSDNAYIIYICTYLINILPNSQHAP